MTYLEYYAAYHEHSNGGPEVEVDMGFFGAFSLLAVCDLHSGIYSRSTKGVTFDRGLTNLRKRNQA